MAVVRGGCAAISATSPRSDAGATNANANANTSPGNEYAGANPHSCARAGNLAGRLPLGQHLHRAAMPVHLRLPGGKAGPLRGAALRFGPVVSGGTALYYRGSRLRLLPPAVAYGSSIGRMRTALSVAVRRPAPATGLLVADCRLRYGGSAIARPAPGAHLRRAAKRAIIPTQPAGFAGRDRIVV